jgi:hypothetical protein
VKGTIKDLMLSSSRMEGSKTKGSLPSIFASRIVALSASRSASCQSYGLTVPRLGFRVQNLGFKVRV